MKHFARSAATRTIAVLALALIGLAVVASGTAIADPAIVITSSIPDGGPTNAQNPEFTLTYSTSDTKDVDFICSIDSDSEFSPCDALFYPSCVAAAPGTQTCSQTLSVMGLFEGPHLLRAFATECDSPCDPDADGVDGPIALRAFTIDRTAPKLSYLAGPSPVKPVLKRGAFFRFAAFMESATFICQVDGGAPAGCVSPFLLPPLENGHHAIAVVAVDAAGNRSVSYEQQFDVDIFKPKKCKRGKSAKAKARHAKCVKANAKAKAKWRKKHWP